MREYIPLDQQFVYAMAGEIHKFTDLGPFDALTALYEGNRRLVPFGHHPSEARLGDLQGKGLLFEPGGSIPLRTRHNIDTHAFHGLERRGVKPEHNGIFIARDAFAGLSQEEASEKMMAIPMEATFMGPVFPFYADADGVRRAENREFPVGVSGQSLYGKAVADGPMEWIVFARLTPLYPRQPEI